MLNVFARLLLIGLLWHASLPASEQHSTGTSSIEEAPPQVVSAGRQEERVAPLKLQAIVIKRFARPQPFSARITQVQVVPPAARACGHPPASRVHVPRRRIPRLRDDRDDP